jgi:hypothetical protein
LCISSPTIPTKASLFHVVAPLDLAHKATTAILKLKKKEEKLTKKHILKEKWQCDAILCVTSVK